MWTLLQYSGSPRQRLSILELSLHCSRVHMVSYGVANLCSVDSHLDFPGTCSHCRQALSHEYYIVYRVVYVDNHSPDH